MTPIELLPGFTDRRVTTADGVEIHAKVGGLGPALLLLHGHPQTLSTWHCVAPAPAGEGAALPADRPLKGGTFRRRGRACGVHGRP